MEDQLIQGEVFGPTNVDWDKLLGVILIASKDSHAEDSSPPHLKILNAVCQNRTDPPRLSDTRMILVMSCPNLLARASSKPCRTPNNIMLRNMLDETQICRPCMMASKCLLLAMMAWYTDNSSSLLKETEEATAVKCLERSLGAIMPR